MALRAPHLYHALRCFGLAAFSLLRRDVEAGAEIPFAFAEHATPGRPALYEYRLLVGPYVEARGRALVALADARFALDELRGEPAAAIFARAHAEAPGSERDALFRAILLPLIIAVAEACGGFDWSDASFDRAYAELEQSVFGEQRAYAAVAPLVGISAGSEADLGGGCRVRVAAVGELAAHWPEAARLAPPAFGREPDRTCVLELERALTSDALDVPDSAGEIADAVTALRLATAAPIAAGPVLFERLDWRPLGVRPVLPIAAAAPPGEPTRLDALRAGVARRLLERLALADDDPELAEALDRWELSLFADEPFRSEQLRESLAALLAGPDGLWAAALRAAVLLGESARERGELLRLLRSLAHGEPATVAAADAVRRALVEALAYGDRARMISSLDETLVGLRPRTVAPAAALAG